MAKFFLVQCNFSIVSALKVSTPSENTGYDAMNMLRLNIKKVFSDEDVEQLESDAGIKESENDVQKESITKTNGSSESECENDEDEDSVEKKQEYHSSSDNDTDDGEPYIQTKKSNKRNICTDSTGKEESVKLKGNTEQGEDNNSSDNQSRRQTILLSATLSHAVEKLAGLAMDRPIFVDAAKENLETAGGDVGDVNDDLVVPQSVNQSYIVTPPKLRMVTLGAYVAGKCQVDSPDKRLLIIRLFRNAVKVSQQLLLLLIEPRRTQNIDIHGYSRYGRLSHGDLIGRANQACRRGRRRFGSLG